MPIEHRADPTPPPHHGQGRGGSKEESFSLRASPSLHPPERPSPRRDDMADHGLGRETRERDIYYIDWLPIIQLAVSSAENFEKTFSLYPLASVHPLASENLVSRDRCGLYFNQSK